MKIVLFEGGDFDLLYPLTYLRPTFELRCGALTLRRKIQEKFPQCELHLEVRDILAEVAADAYGAGAVNSAERLSPDDDVLLVKGGAILTQPAEAYSRDEMAAVTAGGDFVWAYLKADTVAGIGAASARELAEAVSKKLAPIATDDLLIKHPWDAIINNGEQIAADFANVYGHGIASELDERVAVWGDIKDLHVGEGVDIQPWTFIDLRDGPVIIGAGAKVRAHTSIEGPAYIGEKAQLLEAKIREGTSIGPVCRVGGEVEESIMHAYANKYHTGFLGHAYVCEWVNLGALTVNSDLKNDYSTVAVYVNGKPTDTGSMKVGSFIGDHTKTSIATALNTGSVVGIMCNLMAGASVLPKNIPSFCWYLNSRISKGLGLAQALDTARAAMARRDVELTDAMVELIKHTEDITRDEKMAKVKRDRKKAFR